MECSLLRLTRQKCPRFFQLPMQVADLLDVPRRVEWQAFIRGVNISRSDVGCAYRLLRRELWHNNPLIFGGKNAARATQDVFVVLIYFWRYSRCCFKLRIRIQMSDCEYRKNVDAICWFNKTRISHCVRVFLRCLTQTYNPSRNAGLKLRFPWNLRIGLREQWKKAYADTDDLWGNDNCICFG